MATAIEVPTYTPAAKMQVSDQDPRNNNFDNLPNASDGAQFSPHIDFEAFIRGEMTPEGLFQNTRGFVAEYFTNKLAHSFSYQMGSDGNFYAPGFENTVEQMITNGAIYTLNNTTQAAYAIAELHSWSELKRHIRSHLASSRELTYSAKAIPPDTSDKLVFAQISPNRMGDSPRSYSFLNYYSFDPHTGQLDVKQYRLFGQHDAATHWQTLNNWQQNWSEQSLKLEENLYALENLTQTLFSTAKSEAGGAQTQQQIAGVKQELSDANNQILSQIIPLTRNPSFEELFSFSDTVGSEAQIQLLIEEFEPEIQNYVSQIVNASKQDNYQTIVELSFKQLLVKAKIFFQRDEAIMLWGDRAVADIENQILTRTKVSEQLRQLYPEEPAEFFDPERLAIYQPQHTNPISKANRSQIEGKINQLQMSDFKLNGSCNTVTVADNAIDSNSFIRMLSRSPNWLLNSFMNPEKTVWVCDNCGHANYIDTDHDIYAEKCGGCQASGDCS